jgi:hypothetical protein
MLGLALEFAVDVLRTDAELAIPEPTLLARLLAFVDRSAGARIVGTAGGEEAEEQGGE